MEKYRLEYEIKRKGMTIMSFCKALGISTSAYYRKCKGTSEFTQAEIQKAMKLLDLRSPMGIFFAEEVS